MNEESEKENYEAVDSGCHQSHEAWGREAEMELLGLGFHSYTKIHKSDKVYTRKKKHKGGW